MRFNSFRCSHMLCCDQYAMGVHVAPADMWAGVTVGSRSIRHFFSGRISENFDTAKLSSEKLIQNEFLTKHAAWNNYFFPFGTGQIIFLVPN